MATEDFSEVTVLEGRRMRFPELRIAWSAFWGVGALVLLTLWAHSYYAIDVWQGRPFGTRSLHLQSTRGMALVYSVRGRESGFGSITYQRLKEGHGIDDSFRPIFGRESGLGSTMAAYPDAAVVSIPYLVLVVSTADIAALPWRTESRRFTIRDLLIAITVVALLLAYTVYATR